MKDMNLLHIVLIYLVITNVVTFFMYGIDKWKAKKSKQRIRETALLGLAVLGGSIGAWLGMKVWHHKTLHKKFRFGVPVIIIIQLLLIGYFLISNIPSTSCSTNGPALHSRRTLGSKHSSPCQTFSGMSTP